MSHFRPQDSAAIFSPSVARQAASTARDWSYIESWLSSKFPGRPLPAFERNPDTLKALLALAALNEAADEERDLLARAEEDALAEFRSHRDEVAETRVRGCGMDGVTLRESLLDALENQLTVEGQAALDAMAALSVQAGAAFPEPESLGSRMVSMQSDLYELEQVQARVVVLQNHIQREMAQTSSLLKRLQDPSYEAPPELAKQNLDMQRKVKAISAQLPELQSRAAALASSVDSHHPSIDDVARQEQEYLEILARKKGLDVSLGRFEGLPSDPDVARSELESLRRQLHGFTSRRDAAFEGLVERESPIRRR